MEDYHDKVVDVHVHTGVVGNGVFRGMGLLSEHYRSQIGYKIFLLFANVKETEVNDTKLHEKLLDTIANCGLYGVVCLAVDHVYDRNGTARPDLSEVWVGNDYILKLREDAGAGGTKVFFGCSVHPYDPMFETKVRQCVDKGAVVIKWLPSAMQFDLAEELVRQRMVFLATAKDGRPLPLLLHIGGEYAIPTTYERTQSWDFCSWSWRDNLMNSWPFRNRWHTPKVPEIRANIHSALQAGAIVIFAHCGLPYFAPKWLGFLEHSDFDFVSSMVKRNLGNPYPGRCYADISALCTPTRTSYFADVKKLPEEYLLYGSDFPTPTFEIGADAKENWRDLKAFMNGDFLRIAVPQDNLIAVNHREMRAVFGGSAVYTNFARQFL